MPLAASARSSWDDRFVRAADAVGRLGAEQLGHRQPAHPQTADLEEPATGYAVTETIGGLAKNRQHPASLDGWEGQTGRAPGNSVPRPDSRGPAGTWIAPAGGGEKPGIHHRSRSGHCQTAGSPFPPPWERRFLAPAARIFKKIRVGGRTVAIGLRRSVPHWADAGERRFPQPAHVLVASRFGTASAGRTICPGR